MLLLCTLYVNLFSEFLCFFFRLGASSNNVDLSVVSNNDDCAAMSSEPSAGGDLFAQQFSLLTTDKKLELSEVKFLLPQII